VATPQRASTAAALALLRSPGYSATDAKARTTCCEFGPTLVAHSPAPVTEMLRRLFASVIRPPYVRVRNGIGELLFERRLGVRTSGDVELADLGIAAEGRLRYRPIGWLSLRRILPPRAVTADDVFVDIGCGKGRAVLLAAGYPFRRVIGVELSTRLVEIAHENVERTKARLRCKDIVLVNADAVTYQIPDDVTVVFLNNPFSGAIFAAVVKNVLDSYDRIPRPLRIVYGCPIEEATLLATGRIRTIKRVRGFRPGREWSTSNSLRMYAVQAR
jgi:SAM-dependent methyltransferase